MTTPLQEVSRRLAEIRSPGSFATVRTVSPADLRVTVKGVGRIRLPLTKTQALELCAVGWPASHGFKDETRLDTRVRDTWEVPTSRIAIDRRTWNRTLVPMLDAIRRDLGLPDGARLKAELHNMLVYAPGQFFVAHQDSEKADDMIGTLAVVLPSAFSGGELVIEHHGQQLVAGGSRSKLTCVAFYADCHHQVRPVTRGYRCVLTYNLILAGGARAAAQAPSRPVDLLAQHVRRFFETPPPPRWSSDKDREPPDRLVYLLDHQYTQRSLGWTRLKNGDAARVAALREVARQLDCEIFLALADVHETWEADTDDADFGYGRRYGYRGGWYDDDDEEDDHADGGDGTPGVADLIESAVALRHWVGEGAGKRPEAIADHVGSHEWCFTTPSSDLEPFQSEYEGYMGNYGNTVDRWYHRAAVVLWPRERTFVIRARASATWAIGEIAGALRARDEKTARELTARVRPFWTRTASQENARGFFDRTAKAAAGLGDPDLAAMLLQPFTLAHLTEGTAPRLGTLLERYGTAWCQTLIGTWTADPLRAGRQARGPWLATSLPAVCRVLCAGSSPDGMALARWLVREQWTWLVEQRREIREHSSPKDELATLATLGPPALALLESSVLTDDAELSREMIALLASPDEYAADELTGVLRAAHARYPGRTLRTLGLQSARARCAADLTARLFAPERARDDWSIPDVIRCRCSRCATLTLFLRAADRRRFEWPLAKDDRAHVHRIVDGHGLPVTHVTRRTGRPYTLVLEKTPALFTQEAAARKSWQRDLAWLAKTAAAFGG